jgi:hypothetical protein
VPCSFVHCGLAFLEIVTTGIGPGMRTRREVSGGKNFRIEAEHEIQALQSLKTDRAPMSYLGPYLTCL